MAKRFVFIESDSGYIWGDETADTLAKATEQMLEESGSNDGRTYEAHTSWSLDASESGYYVYSVPADFPAIPDGQDQEMIERVQAEGTRLETLIEAEPEEEDEEEEDEDETLGYIALNADGSEIIAAGWAEEDVDAAANDRLDEGEKYSVEIASEALIEYVSATGTTPAIVEIDGVNRMKTEAAAT